jgi:hypothetical protein
MKSQKKLDQLVQTANIDKQALVYTKFNQTIKEYNKVNKLIKPNLIEHCQNNDNYFQFRAKERFQYIGSMELVIKNTSRFDVTQFKKDHPELYDKYVVDGQSFELRSNYKKVIK